MRAAQPHRCQGDVSPGTPSTDGAGKRSASRALTRPSKKRTHGSFSHLCPLVDNIMRFLMHAMRIFNVFDGKLDADAAVLVPEVVGGVSYIHMTVLIRR